MLAIAQQTVLIAGVLVAAFAGPMLGIGFLLLRKRHARARRRSPIGRDLLRGPGHTVREELDEATLSLQWDVALMMVVPLMTVTIFLAQAHLRGGLQEMSHAALLSALLLVGFVGFMVYRLWKSGQRIDNLKTGFDAELAVGQELDQLMRQGAIVFHDLPAEKFNIDHVVISTAGVFAVETKGFTKHERGKVGATVEFDGNVLKFPTWTTKAPLEQARRQAEWLAKWLAAATGSPVRVHPVVALPGWYVKRTGRGEVRVFNGRELSGLLNSRGSQTLTAQDVQRVAHQVEQRCRTVAPRYSEV